MAYKHTPLEGFVKNTDKPIEYIIGEGADRTDYTMDGYIFRQDEKSIFYTAFNDLIDEENSKYGFLLMCSKTELVELVNHLRMIRDV